MLYALESKKELQKNLDPMRYFKLNTDTLVILIMFLTFLLKYCFSVKEIETC